MIALITVQWRAYRIRPALSAYDDLTDMDKDTFFSYLIVSLMPKWARSKFKLQIIRYLIASKRDNETMSIIDFFKCLLKTMNWK